MRSVFHIFKHWSMLQHALNFSLIYFGLLFLVLCIETYRIYAIKVLKGNVWVLSGFVFYLVDSWVCRKGGAPISKGSRWVSYVQNRPCFFLFFVMCTADIMKNRCWILKLRFLVRTFHILCRRRMLTAIPYFSKLNNRETARIV